MGTTMKKTVGILLVAVLLIMGGVFPVAVQRSLQAGLNAHLTKPVQPEALYETLESLIKD